MKQWNLIRLRKEANLTQEDVANMLGITLKTYNLKENGVAAFVDVEMFKLRDRFDKPMDEIFLPPNSILNRIGLKVESGLT